MFDASVLSRHPVDIGMRSEGAIFGELVKRGYVIFTPFSYNNRTDVLIEVGDGLLRAQCKTGRLLHGAVTFSKASTRCSRTAVHRRPYGREIDLYLVYLSARDEVYVISVEDALSGAYCLRIEPPRNGQRKGVRWAKDYLLGEGARALAVLPPPA